jgi:hypothetical protein
MAVKEVHLGGRDSERDSELAMVARRYGLIHEPGNECALTILYGYGLSDNRLLYIVCPSAICRSATFPFVNCTNNSLRSQPRLFQKITFAFCFEIVRRLENTSFVMFLLSE